MGRLDSTINFLKEIGIFRVSDDFVSDKRFGDKGQYRIEVPGIQSPKSMQTLLEKAEDDGVVLHRVTQTKGIMLLSDGEIRDMVDLARSYNVELFLSVGPRAIYDTSASVHTSEGSRMGYRLRGYDNLVYAIEDIRRAVDLGVRGILLYDEGLLWCLNQMKDKGLWDGDVFLKMSAHAGHGNPASVKLWESLGLDSFNPVRDLQIPMIAAIRAATGMALDLHTENPRSSGGFIRHYEVPDMIRVASPVYLKTGGSIALSHNWNSTSDEAILRLKQVKLVYDVIRRYMPEADCSPSNSKYLAVPE